ncbi:MAG: PAS domain-containing protein, partial [Acidimicrobiia bacterium]|nr:PAS domain-containing protein [Acidimicrobiia bacterium]
MGRRGDCRGRRRVAPYTQPIAVEPSVPEEKARLLSEANRALRLSEQRLQALLEHVSDVITVLGADGRVVYSSPAGTRMLGYPPGFWVGQNVFELVHPDDAAHVVEVFQRGLVAGGQTEPVEFRMRHADGGWRYVEAIGNNLLDDPAVAGMIVATRDVTDRHEAEVAVRDSEARFRSLVQRSYDVIAVCDTEGVVRYVTPSVELMLGVKPEEVTGSNGFEFAHPEDRQELMGSLGRLLDGTSRQRAVEFRALHRDGSLRHLELVPTNLADDPAVAGMIVAT